MRKIDGNHKFDFRNKTYVYSLGKWGAKLLKHFTLAFKDGRQVSRWRFISMESRDISNILITAPLDTCAFMHKTPEEAIKNILSHGDIPASGGGILYEIDDLSELFPPA